MVVAIDGPAGAGKSTVCRLLARSLGYVYLDTGAMYRAVAWSLLQEKITPEDEDEVRNALGRLRLSFTLKSGALSISSGGRVLDDELRRPEMAGHASRFSQLHTVREYLTKIQRRLGTEGRIVAEGRDMATVVFPDARVKIFLTADLETRARRRAAEYAEKGTPATFEEIESQIRARDHADSSRSIAPLRAAPDAITIDTSEMEIEQVVKCLVEIVSQSSACG